MDIACNGGVTKEKMQKSPLEKTRERCCHCTFHPQTTVVAATVLVLIIASFLGCKRFGFERDTFNPNDIPDGEFDVATIFRFRRSPVADHSTEPLSTKYPQVTPPSTRSYIGQCQHQNSKKSSLKSLHLGTYSFSSSGIKRNTDGYSRTARIDSSIIQDIFRESLKKALEPKIEPIFKGNSIIFRPRSYAERYAVEKGRGERNELRREVFSFITNKSFKQPEISEEEYSIPDHDKTTTPSIYTETYTAKWSSLVQLPETIPRSTEESAYTDDDILEDDISKTKQRSGTVRTTEFEELRATNIEENPITTEFDVADEFEEGESSSSFEVNPNSSTESTVLDEKMVVEDVTKPSFSFPEKEEEDDLLEKTSIGDGFTEEKAFQTNDEQRVKDEIDFGNEEETTVIGTTLATTTPKVKSTTEDIHEDVEEELENTIPNAIIPISLKDHKQEVNISTSSASKALSKISTEDSAEGYEGRKFGELRGREITPMFCTSFRMPSFSLSNEINSLNEFGDPLAKDRVARKNAPRRIVSEHEFDYDDIDDDDFPVTERACHHHHHQDSSCHLHRGDHHGHEQKELMLEILIIVLCCVSSCMLLFQTFRFVSDYLSNGEQEYCGTSRCRSGGTLTLTPDTINDQVLGRKSTLPEKGDESNSKNGSTGLNCKCRSFGPSKECLQCMALCRSEMVLRPEVGTTLSKNNVRPNKTMRMQRERTDHPQVYHQGFRAEAVTHDESRYEIFSNQKPSSFAN